MKPRRGIRAKWLVWAGVALVVGVYAWSGPYLFPVEWGLGPCLKDWTSPSSYLPRVSPLVTLDGPPGGWSDAPPDAAVRVCYGAPSARGRVLFGEEALVPDGQYWRTGANEPTRVFTNVPLSLMGVSVPPGRYSLYTIPGPIEWEVILNRSTFHWGYDFSPGVLAQEVGRAMVPVEASEEFVETFRIAWSPGGRSLDLAWGDVLVRVPVEVGS